MNTPRFFFVAVLVMISLGWTGKQKIIVRLKDPLRAEPVRIRLPEANNGRGETRDLETTLQLGDPAQTDAPKTQDVSLKLNMVLRSVGKGGVQVTLTLPSAGFVELIVIDFYGKNLATLLADPMTPGIYALPSFNLKDNDNNTMKFMALRINGKVVLKRVITKVR